MFLIPQPSRINALSKTMLFCKPAGNVPNSADRGHCEDRGGKVCLSRTTSHLSLMKPFIIAFFTPVSHLRLSLISIFPRSPVVTSCLLRTIFNGHFQLFSKCRHIRKVQCRQQNKWYAKSRRVDLFGSGHPYVI